MNKLKTEQKKDEREKKKEVRKRREKRKDTRSVIKNGMLRLMNSSQQQFP